jgi:3-mercaptopyruvate sulfurtransferase SseA
MMSIFTKSVI